MEKRHLDGKEKGVVREYARGGKGRKWQRMQRAECAMRLLEGVGSRADGIPIDLFGCVLVAKGLLVSRRVAFDTRIRWVWSQWLVCVGCLFDPLSCFLTR